MQLFSLNPKFSPHRPGRRAGEIFTVADDEYKIKSLSLRFTDKTCVLAVTGEKPNY